VKNDGLACDGEPPSVSPKPITEIDIFPIQRKTLIQNSDIQERFAPDQQAPRAQIAEPFIWLGHAGNHTIARPELYPTPAPRLDYVWSICVAQHRPHRAYAGIPSGYLQQLI
jgi:hypothetical protein